MDGAGRELGALYETRYVSFRNALATVTGSRESARDAVQEAFARARDPFRYDRLGVGVCLCGRVAPDGETLAGPVVLEGETTNGRADSLLLASRTASVSRSRSSGSANRSIPPSSSTAFRSGTGRRGHLPTTLTLLAADGDELDTREISGITTKGSLSPR